MIVVAASLVVLFSALGALLAWRSYRSERARAIDETATLARAAAAAAEQALQDRINTLEALAAVPAVRAADLPAMRAFFTDLAMTEPSLSRMLWADTSGIARTGTLAVSVEPPLSVADRDYFRAVTLTERPYVSAGVLSWPDNQPTVAIAVPTRDGAGSLSGMLVLGLTLEQFEETLTQFQAGKTGRLLVVDRAGQLVIDDEPGTTIDDVSDSPLLERARAEGSGVLAGVTGVRGLGDRVVAYAAVPTGGWVVLEDRSAEEAFGQERRTLLGTLVALLGVGLAGTGGAVWAARRLDHTMGERQRAQGAEHVLAEASRLLAESLEYETTLSNVGRLVVPALADWCAIDLLDKEGRITRDVVIHADPARTALAEALRRFPPDPAWDTPATRVLRSGRSELIPVVDQAVAAGVSRGDAEYLATIRELAPRSILIAPLAARGRALGAISLAITEPGRCYTARDLPLAEELARRCAVAVENAQLYRQAQEALRVRDEFLSSISHDLRTPLTSVKGFAQLLRRQAAREGMDEASWLGDGLARIDTATTRMTALVGDLLDMARAETGRPPELNRRPVDLIALVRRVAEEQGRGAAHHQLVVNATLPELTGRWDGDRLERVFTNLLLNAVKYSPDGDEITVSLTRECGEAADGGWVKVTVRDHGIGIPAEDLPRIFERFHRGSNVIGRMSGTGIGLAGARQIVEQHGGTMSVESVEGAGATFTVRLPVVSSE